MRVDPEVLERFFDVLVEEIDKGRPEYLRQPFTVAEIYQELVPYRTHRDAIGVEMNGDYEDALLHLLAGHGQFLVLESEPARRRIQQEVEAKNPNTGLYREYAAVEVRLNPAFVSGTIRSASNGGEGRPSQEPSTPPELFKDEGFSPAASTPPALPTKESAGPGGSVGKGPGKAQGVGVPSHSTPSSQKSASKVESTRTKAAGGPSKGGEPTLCPDCHQSLPDRDSLRFCPFCGTNVFVVDCGECGEELERAWSFCLACGTPSEG